jgi:hypothetical protein
MVGNKQSLSCSVILDNRIMKLYELLYPKMVLTFDVHRIASQMCDVKISFESFHFSPVIKMRVAKFFRSFMVL